MAANFSNEKLQFGKDLVQVIKDIFYKYNFRKLTFTVFVGNPIEKSYDKMVNKYGGRIVGIQKKHTRLQDGKYYDEKIYEIMREDFINKVKYKSKEIIDEI